jgi:hypothetical protein
MAGTKISALPASAGANLTDLIPAVQSGVTNKETLQQVLNLFNTNIQLASDAQVTGLPATIAGLLPLPGGTMTGPLILYTNSPSTALEAASKGYVDLTASGFTVILAALAATTVNLNATAAGAGVGATLTNAGAMAAFAVDGVSPAINSRILVKNQTLAQHNGVYTLTTVGSGAANWVLTRATDYDQAAEIKPGTLIAVNSGTVNATTSWLETATVVTVDTDPILFSQFSFGPNSFFQIANNLSEGTPATMRTNLGLGTIATKAASNAGKTTAVMADAATTIGNIAVFTDIAGTIGDGGVSPNLSLNNLCTGRLTLTTGVPVTTSDVVAVGTLYFTPYKGNKIALYDGAAVWNVRTLTELSIAVPAVANQLYDVYVFDNAGTPTLELTAWTNDTTRATAIVLQDGVYVKNGATTRRYVGSFRTIAASQTDDSLTKRYVWNYYNRVSRQMKAIDTTNSWTYSTAAYRQANANTANQLDMVIGVIEEVVNATVIAKVSTTTASVSCAAGIGLDSTTINSAINGFNSTDTTNSPTEHATWSGYPGVGRHFLAWLELASGTPTQTWYGDIGGTSMQTGITGTMIG